jgi:hypothetical protein
MQETRSMSISLKVGAPLPDNVGALADVLKEIKELRIGMDKQVDEVRRREREVEELIMTRLEDSGDTGAMGLRYKVQLVKKTKPKIADSDKFFAWVQQTGAFDMLQKRVAEKAVMDWSAENGDTLPDGLERIHIPSLSLTKI